MRGKVVLVRFPFDDLSASKVRPAVCLTGAVGPHRHVVLGFITSQPPAQPLPSDLLLDPSYPDFPTTGLRVRSTLRLHRLMTVTADVLLRELGELSAFLQGEVDAKLRALFELERVPPTGALDAPAKPESVP